MKYTFNMQTNCKDTVAQWRNETIYRQWSIMGETIAKAFTSHVFTGKQKNKQKHIYNRIIKGRPLLQVTDESRYKYLLFFFNFIKWTYRKPSQFVFWWDVGAQMS